MGRLWLVRKILRTLLQRLGVLVAITHLITVCLDLQQVSITIHTILLRAEEKCHTEASLLLANSCFQCAFPSFSSLSWWSFSAS